MAQDIKIHKGFKINLKNFKFGTQIGALLLLTVFFNFFWPLMTIYMFLFMFMGYEKDSGFKEVLSLGVGQIIIIIPTTAIFSLVTDNPTAINNSTFASAIALALIIIAEILSKTQKQGEAAMAME